MKRNLFKKLTLVILASISSQATAMNFFRNTAVIEPELMSELPYQFNPSQAAGPLAKTAAIVDQGDKALRYIGRDEVVDSLNGISEAANNLVANGVTLHFGPHKIIPQIGFCTLGCVAAICGLAVLTHTALQKDQTNSKRKYLAGAGMTALGIASLFTSYFLSR